MEFSKKRCIVCMSAHNYGGFVYFNNSIDAPKENNN